MAIRLFGKKKKELLVDLSAVKKVNKDDKILINSDGKMKCADSSLIGGNSGSSSEADNFYFVNVLIENNGTEDVTYLNKTWQEIKNAVDANKICISITKTVINESSCSMYTDFLTLISNDEGGYFVTFKDAVFVSSSATGILVKEEGPAL